MEEHEGEGEGGPRLSVVSETEEVVDRVGAGQRRINTALRRKRSQSLVDLQHMTLNGNDDLLVERNLIQMIL